MDIDELGVTISTRDAIERCIGLMNMDEAIELTHLAYDGGDKILLRQIAIELALRIKALELVEP